MFHFHALTGRQHLGARTARRAHKHRKATRSRRFVLEALEARQMLCATHLAPGLTAFPAAGHAAGDDPLPPGFTIAQTALQNHWDHTGTSDWIGDPNPADGLGTEAASTAVASSLHPLTDIPLLHSNPSATVKLYLDFDGHFEPVWGGYTNVTTPVYDSDGDPTKFSDAEFATMYVAWSRVAEDYAPFNIDVTTEEPPELAPGVPESVANGVALRVAIGGNSRDWTGGDYGGLAYIDNFTNSIANVVYMFSSGSANGTAIGDTASHESGHGFGLQHQSTYDENGVKIFEYAPGVGNWAPIMGGGNAPINTWQYGTSSVGPTIYQDDMAVIARSANGFGFRADDHGNTVRNATPLIAADNTWSGSGIIETNTDVDAFSFQVPAVDTYRIDLGVAPIGSNLHAVMELRNATGALLAAANPAAGVGASIAAVLASNTTYFVSVGKTSEYGRVGAYTLNVAAPPAGVSVAAPQLLTTREGGPPVSFTVSLDTQPTADVTIPISSSDVGEGVLSTDSLSFTPANWNVPQTVSVIPVDDGVRDGDIQFTIVLGSATSDDSEYSGIDPADIAVVNLDGSSAGWLYWIDNGNDVIQRSTFNGLNVQTVVDLKAVFGIADYVPRYLAVDALGGKMYWTDSATGRIQRADLDGLNAETLLSGFTGGGLRGIAVDGAAGKMYWVDYAAQKIQRANLDGSGVQDIVTGALSGVREITLDAAAGKIYWGDYGESNIRRANLDGTNIEVLWQGVDADNPAAIALDTTTGKMYWADSTSDTILRANLDGSNVEPLIDMHSFYPDSTIASLAIDPAAGKIYFSDFLNKAVFRANLDGSDVVTIASDGIGIAQGIALLYPAVTVSPTTGLVTSESGGFAMFQVGLTTPPKANVTIQINSSNTAEGSASPNSITFTPNNWNVAQTVTVTGVDDTAVDGSKSYAVIVSPATSSDPDYNGIDPRDVSVTNLDNEAKFRVVNDATSDLAYLYTADGTPRGTTSLSSANSGPRGIASTAAGDKSWVIDANRTVYVYNSSGGVSGSWTAASMANNAQPEGIATNGTDVWIVDNRSDTVFRYTGATSRTSGSQTAASSFKLNSSNTNPKDIVTDGSSLWVVDDATTDRVFKYSLTGSLLGSWTIDGANKTPTGITLDPTSPGNIWIVDSGTDRVYQYDDAAARTSGSQPAALTFVLASGNTNPQAIASNSGSTGVASTDLAISSSAVSTAVEGSLVTFNLTVTNNGPGIAASVVLTDTLGANWLYSSASANQGSIQQSGGVVTFDIGSVAPGQTVTASVSARPLEAGNLTNSAGVTGNVLDTNLNNNTTGKTVSVTAAPIVVSGSPLTLSGKKQNNITTATFTHASGVHPASYYTATINWGDGTTSAGSISQSGSTYTVKGSHTYPNGAAYTVTTTVARASGAAGSAVAQAAALDEAFFALASAPISVASSQRVSFIPDARPAVPLPAGLQPSSLDVLNLVVPTADLARIRAFDLLDQLQSYTPGKRPLWTDDASDQHDEWNMTETHGHDAVAALTL